MPWVLKVNAKMQVRKRGIHEYHTWKSKHFMFFPSDVFEFFCVAKDVNYIYTKRKAKGGHGCFLRKNTEKPEKWIHFGTPIDVSEWVNSSSILCLLDWELHYFLNSARSALTSRYIRYDIVYNDFRSINRFLGSTKWTNQKTKWVQRKNVFFNRYTESHSYTAFSQRAIVFVDLGQRFRFFRGSDTLLWTHIEQRAALLFYRICLLATK